MNNKILSLVVVSVLTFSLAGCQVEEKSDKLTSSSAAESTLIETTTINAVYEGQIDNNSIEVKVDGVTQALRLRDMSRDQLKELNPQKGDSLKIDMFKDNGQEVIYSIEKATSIPGKKAIQSTLADYVGQIDNNSIEVIIEDAPIAMRLTDLAKEQLASLKLQKGDVVKIETFKNDNGQQTIQLIEKATSIPGKKTVQSTLADYVGQIDNNSIEVIIEDGPIAMRLTDLAKQQLASLKLQKGDVVKIETFKNDNGQQTIQLIEKATSIPGKKAVQSTLADYVGQIDNNSIEVIIEDGPIAMRLTDLAKQQLASLKLQKGDVVKIETFKNDNGQQTIQLIEKAK